MDWLERGRSSSAGRGCPGVLVTVIKVRGHAPRDPGAKMVVGADHSWGSVGGGNLEETAVARARELIAAGALANPRPRSRGSTSTPGTGTAGSAAAGR